MKGWNKIKNDGFCKDCRKPIIPAWVRCNECDAKKRPLPGNCRCGKQIPKCMKFTRWCSNECRNKYYQIMKKIRYLSTFSGIGGFELGIGNRGICVGFSENDKHATKVYQHHFPEHKAYGDITKIDAGALPDFDLLVGGFPCQAFSIAGRRRGFEDTRGTLFFDLARILFTKRPRLFLFENVKGLLSHDGGRTFKTIIATIDELGYDCQWQVLNSRYHGVPQNRERVFIAGHLRGTPRPEVFPFRENAPVSVQQNEPDQRRSQTVVSPTLKGANIKADNAFIVHNIYGGFKETKPRVFEHTAPTVRTSAGGGHLPSVVVRIPEATKKGYAEARVGQSINLSVPNSKTRRGRVSDIANTIDTGMQQHTLTSDYRIRRLTPVECERLMGFPDNWTNVEMSDTQRYKQCGNAVVVNVVKDIMDRLLV